MSKQVSSMLPPAGLQTAQSPPAAAKVILSIRIASIDSVLTVAQLPIYIG